MDGINRRGRLIWLTLPTNMKIANKYPISEILDIEALTELFQHLSNVTGIAIAVIDLDGNILIAINWQDICTNFHRINPETAARCATSDTLLASQLKAGQSYNIYRCKNGLVDVAVPIIVDDVHIGNLFTGQFFFQQPDYRYFERQAVAFEFDREAYLEALSHVPVFNQEEVERTVGLLCKMAQVIGAMGLNRLRLIESNQALTAANTRMKEEISERKKAESSLRESEEKYRTLFNRSRDAIMVLIPDEGFVDCNPSTLELFACKDRRSFIRKNPAGLSPEFQPDGSRSSVKAQEMIDLALAKGSHFFEWIHRRVDGKEFIATVLLTRTQIQGKEVLQATVRDVTESKLAEAELKRHHDHLEELVGERTAALDRTNRLLQEDIRRREEVEERLRTANRELEAFVYTVSHDLRTPLTVIIGYADFLRDSCQDRLNEQELKFLSDIGGSGKKMVALMEDLLNLAKVRQAERLAEPIDAGEVVKEVVCGLDEILSQAGVTVDIGALPSLRVPRTLLAQIFDNLLGNAVRYGSNPGDAIEVGGERTGGKVRFYVRDSGPGIPAEERDQIFEVFYRGTTGKDKKGTGIGLATVQKIARLLGGRAWVEETPGGGSTFMVEVTDEI